MVADDHVTPPINEMVNSGMLSSNVGISELTMSNVITYLTPAINRLSTDAHRNRRSFSPSHETAPIPFTSPAMGQNIIALGPPRYTRPTGCLTIPDPIPSITNPGVLGDVEYWASGVDPFTSTPLCRVMVMVLGEVV